MLRGGRTERRGFAIGLEGSDGRRSLLFCWEDRRRRWGEPAARRLAIEGLSICLGDDLAAVGAWVSDRGMRAAPLRRGLGGSDG